MPRYAPSSVTTPQQDHRARPPAAPRRPTARCPSPAARPSRPGSRSRVRAPGPSGTAWRRTSSGESTASTPGSPACSSSAVPCALEQERVAGRERRRRPAQVLAAALDREHHQVAGSSVTMPGNTASPMSGERGGIDHLGQARRRPSSAAARSRCVADTAPSGPGPSATARAGAVASEPVLLDERPGVAADRSGRRASCGVRARAGSRRPEHERRRRSPRGPAGRRPARTRRTRSRCRVSVRRVVRHDARSRACRSAPASTPRGPRTRAASAAATARRRCRTAMTTTTGSSAATAPLTLMSAVSPATSSIVRARARRVRLAPAQAMSRWPAQAVTPVASRPSLTTNRRAMNSTVGSPKPASAWSSVSTPVAHSASAAPMATSPPAPGPRRTARRRPPGSRR